MKREKITNEPCPGQVLGGTVGNRSRIPGQTPRKYLDRIRAEESVKPAHFCQRWFGIDTIEFGDRQQCDREISKLLGVKPTTVRDWGEAPAYPKMPNTHRRNLTHYHYRLLERFS